MAVILSRLSPQKFPSQKVDAELKAALADLEKEKQAAISSLDDQVEKLGEEILTRILPEGVKI